jgi:hypothetical protein
MSEAGDAATHTTNNTPEAAPDSPTGDATKIRNMYLPTEEACEQYNMRRWLADYGALNEGEKQFASSGALGGAVDRLEGLARDVTGFDELKSVHKAFLTGPQFQFAPGNIIQDVAAQYTLGFYNGPESAWWNSKIYQARTQNSFTADGPAPIKTEELFVRARAVNSVWLEAKRPAPFTVKSVKKNINGQEAYVSEYDYGSGISDEDLIQWRLNILPNWDHQNGLEFNHEHTWGRSEDFFTHILKMATDIGAGAIRMAERIQQFSNNEGPNPNISIVKPDIADTYQSTNRLTLEIPFTLFTKVDFYRDIFAPIMLLNYLSFPKRKDPTAQVQEVLKNTIAATKEATENLQGGTPTSDTEISSAEGDKEDTSGADSAMNFMNSIIPGFRIFAADPPHYFNIRHSAGLFTFKNCVVSGFTYKYLGPWVNTTNVVPKSQAGEENAVGPGAPGDSFSSLGPTDALKVRQKSFWEFWKTPNSINDSQWTRTILTYPLAAECVLKLRVLDPVFAEDWIVQLDNYRKTYEDGAKQTATQEQLSPSGDILSLDGSNPLFGG